MSHPSHSVDISGSKKSPRRQAPPKAPPPPRQTAKVKQLAEEKTTDHVRTDVESHILARIRKCLDRANHPTTPEMEAKAALHMSSRLMAQYNVTQADVLAQATDSEQQVHYAGQSIVSIKVAKDPFAKAISQTWVYDAVNAMQLYFDCKSYSEARTSSIEWTFYGIAPNTVAAAIAFEMTHNLILEWARGKKGATNSYCLGVARGLWEMAREDKRQEERQAKLQEQEKMSARLMEESLERQKELDRLNSDGVRVPEAYKGFYAAEVADEDPTSNDLTPGYNFAGQDTSSSDSEDDLDCPFPVDRHDDAMEIEPTFKEEDTVALDPEADFEVELQRIIKRERSSTPLAKIKCEPFTSRTKVEDSDVDVKPKLERRIQLKLEGECQLKSEEDDQSKLGEEDTASPGENSLWASASQLILFRATASKIADEYLKSTKTKLSADRKRVGSIKDRGAYEQGKRDSRKIDVKRRRLE